LELSFFHNKAKFDKTKRLFCWLVLLFVWYIISYLWRYCWNIHTREKTKYNELLGPVITKPFLVQDQDQAQVSKW